MAHAGQVLENPISGEKIIFRQTAADTDGELLAIELVLAPGGAVPGAHVHPEQEERFEVVSGTMGFRLGMKRVTAGPGETVIVPAGKIHKFFNAGDEPAHVLVEVRPALEMERLFETVVSLAQEGRCMRSGMPKPLDLALFTREFRREVRAPFPPPLLVRAALAPLAWTAKLRGRTLRPAYA
jgi:mannose-6-phosphate isomerase-like protein (cupin superfamily)